MYHTGWRRLLHYMETTTGPAWGEALAGTNVHAVDAACLSVPVATVWSLTSVGAAPKVYAD